MDKMKLIFINGIPTSMIFGKKVDAWWFSENNFDVTIELDDVTQLKSVVNNIKRLLDLDVDIELVDHVIVGRISADAQGRGFHSFREAGLI